MFNEKTQESLPLKQVKGKDKTLPLVFNIVPELLANAKSQKYMEEKRKNGHYSQVIYLCI